MSPVVINIFFIKINVLQTTSSLNIGQNYMADWNTFNKSISGTGSQYGDQSSLDAGDILVDDSDLVDMPIVKETFPNKTSEFLKWDNIIK